MEDHIRKVFKKEEVKVHYLGKNIQNEIIILLTEIKISHNINEIKKVKYYSIILNCSSDVGKIE